MVISQRGVAGTGPGTSSQSRVRVKVRSGSRGEWEGGGGGKGAKYLDGRPHDARRDPESGGAISPVGSALAHSAAMATKEAKRVRIDGAEFGFVIRGPCRHSIFEVTRAVAGL